MAPVTIMRYAQYTNSSPRNTQLSQSDLVNPFLHTLAFLPSHPGLDVPLKALLSRANRFIAAIWKIDETLSRRPLKQALRHSLETGVSFQTYQFPLGRSPRLAGVSKIWQCSSYLVSIGRGNHPVIFHRNFVWI